MMMMGGMAMGRWDGGFVCVFLFCIPSHKRKTMSDPRR